MRMMNIIIACVAFAFALYVLVADKAFPAKAAFFLLLALSAANLTIARQQRSGESHDN